MKKTNAMRILESENINFEIIEYSTKDGIGGVDVAEKLGEDQHRVFKTLVKKPKKENISCLLFLCHQSST